MQILKRGVVEESVAAVDDAFAEAEDGAGVVEDVFVIILIEDLDVVEDLVEEGHTIAIFLIGIST